MGFRTDIRPIPATSTNTTGNATNVVLPQGGVAGHRLYITAIAVSYQNPQTAAKLVTMTDGATTVWSALIPGGAAATGARFPFLYPITISTGATATVSASASASAIVSMEFYLE